MAHGKQGPSGPKSSMGGKKGTNRRAKGKGSKGGKMTGRLTPPHPGTIGGSTGPGAPY